jgi:hypothetical protein
MLGLEFARDFCPYNSTDFFSFLFLRSQRRPSFVSLSSGTLVPSLSVFVADGDTSPGCGRHRAMTPGCSRHAGVVRPTGRGAAGPTLGAAAAIRDGPTDGFGEAVDGIGATAAGGTGAMGANLGAAAAGIGAAAHNVPPAHMEFPGARGNDVRGFFANDVGATVATRQGAYRGSRFVCMRGRGSTASIGTETVADQIMRNSGRGIGAAGGGQQP